MQNEFLLPRWTWQAMYCCFKARIRGMTTHVIVTMEHAFFSIFFCLSIRLETCWNSKHLACFEMRWHLHILSPAFPMTFGDKSRNAFKKLDRQRAKSVRNGMKRFVLNGFTFLLSLSSRCVFSKKNDFFKDLWHLWPNLFTITMGHTSSNSDSSE